jgi:FAD:protein FMN transferase
MPELAEGAPASRRRRAALLLVAALVAGCAGEAPRVRETLIVWGTEASVEIAGLPAERAQPAIAAVAERMIQLTGEWHAWQPSEVVRINAALRRGEAVDAPESVLALVARSRPLVRKTRRLFDPGIGELIALWGFHTDDYPIRTPAPDPAVLDAWLAQRPSLLDLRIDGQRLSAREGSRVQLDFGAVGEGAAIEVALAVLRERGVDNALITLGGDMMAIGGAGGRPWRVGIEDPVVGGGARLAELELQSGEGLFTSGSYARFRAAPSGERWPHVLDPRTARPVAGVALTAVLADDPVLADAASTVLMIAGPAEFASVLHRLGLRCALLLTEQNELLITRAMQQRIRLQRQPVALGPALGEDGRCSGG